MTTSDGHGLSSKRATYVRKPPDLQAIHWQLRLAVCWGADVHVAQRLKRQWPQLPKAGFQFAINDQVLYQAQGCAQMLLHMLAFGSLRAPSSSMQLRYKTLGAPTKSPLPQQCCDERMASDSSMVGKPTSLLSTYVHTSSAICSINSGSRHWKTGCKASATLRSDSSRARACSS